MKLALICVYAAACVALASARTPKPTTAAPSPSPSGDGSGDANDDSVDAGTVRPAGGSADNDVDTKTTAPSTGPASTGGASPLDNLKQKMYKDEWHMKPVRVIHARVQSDSPALIEGRFVSSFGNGDLAKGYLSAMDNVNTASVEGALMYVQAEGINVNSRATADRCTRKNNMQNIVFYDIAIVQTNESIAEFSSTWKSERDTFEYGPMVPMDGGRCTAQSSVGSKETLPKACLQYNGENGAANLGPFVGGYIKDDDVRAPYPSNYWFSFPNTCPTKAWSKKTEECRTSTRKGLCDLGVAPDGVQCTFAYDILGWIPIDDVVGITSIVNKDTKKGYTNFTEWCQASTKNNEFVGDSQSGEMKSGLAFWKNPLDKDANSERAQAVVDLYNKIVAGTFKSGQIDPALVKSFKPLPEVETLRKDNPGCYESVPSCNRGNGCRREGYSQLCQPCASKQAGCMTSNKFSFPSLVKAEVPTTAPSSASGSGSSEEEENAETEGSDGTAIESPSAAPEDSSSSSSTKKKKTAAPTQSASSSPATLALSASAVALLLSALNV